MLLLYPPCFQALLGTVFHWEKEVYNNTLVIVIMTGASYKFHYPLQPASQSLGAAGIPASPADGRWQGIGVQLN